jgi:hypothetical protein
MNFMDHLNLAKKLGIDVKAQPSDEMKADPEFQASVAFFEGMIKDIDPKLASRFRDRFARYLSAGKQLAQKAPGIGTFSHVPDGDKIKVMYQSPNGQIPVMELDASKTVIIQDTINVCLSTLSVIMSAIGVKAGYSALKKGAEKVIRASSYGTFQTAVKGISSSGSDKEKTMEIVCTIIEFSAKAGDLGTAIWACLSDMSWWDILITIVGILAMLVAIAFTAGGAAAAAFAIKLALLAAAIGILIKDIIKLVSDLTSSNDSVASPAMA